MKRLLCLLLVPIIAACLTTAQSESGELALPAGGSVYSDGKLISVSDLQAGDVIETVDGRRVRITSVTDTDERLDAVCLGVLSNMSAPAYIVGPGIAVTGGIGTGAAQDSGAVAGGHSSRFSILREILGQWLGGLFGL